MKDWSLSSLFLIFESMFNGDLQWEYTCVTLMSLKKDIFGNWIGKTYVQWLAPSEQEDQVKSLFDANPKEFIVTEVNDSGITWIHKNW